MGKRNGNAFAGKSFQQIMMQQATQSANESVYCRYCGHDLKKPTINSTQYDSGYANEWELENNAHIKCYQKHYGGRR